MKDSHVPIRILVCACIFGASSVLPGCKSGGERDVVRSSESTRTSVVDLPPNADPAPELAELAFMAGRWIGVNPNKTVNEEHWMSPRGNNMAALFRQIRRDGKPGLVEVTLITAEPEGVFLRLRHLHGQLDVPKNRPNVSVFRMVSAGNNVAQFAGTGEAEQVTAVIYRLIDANTLESEIQFAPDSKEKGFTTRYTRESPR